jgi:hypothetical protein
MGLNRMEYKKSAPIHGKLDGRYTTLYEYEFPRATRTKGQFLPLGSVRLREFIYSDGAHGQLVQITTIPARKLAKSYESREMVDKVLYLGREVKKFREGVLISQELTGEIREYPPRKLICLGEILAQKEKISLFDPARRMKNSKLRQRRIKRWKIRLHLIVILAILLLGGVCGVLLQKHDLLDLKENPFYQNYILSAFNSLSKLFL